MHYFMENSDKINLTSDLNLFDLNQIYLEGYSFIWDLTRLPFAVLKQQSFKE